MDLGTVMKRSGLKEDVVTRWKETCYDGLAVLAAYIYKYSAHFGRRAYLARPALPRAEGRGCERDGCKRTGCKLRSELTHLPWDKGLDPSPLNRPVKKE
ncbi:hypothetical protein EVAR_941_1 [Eumeta japonica]|uniref:Uncharacterized protein n=1 Tax=Eumeta variegata TaxID=151549 RepID=A0A4C1SE70_EUMVA|nr:hypothetical protein EVAR_941_1 [Eumeta japonica]